MDFEDVVLVVSVRQAVRSPILVVKGAGIGNCIQAWESGELWRSALDPPDNLLHGPQGDRILHEEGATAEPQLTSIPAFPGIRGATAEFTFTYIPDPAGIPGAMAGPATSIPDPAGIPIAIMAEPTTSIPDLPGIPGATARPTYTSIPDPLPQPTGKKKKGKKGKRTKVRIL
jgi:hypothetical protein